MFANRKLSQVFFSIIAILTMIISSFVPSSVLAQSGDGNGRQITAQTDGDGAKRQVNTQTGRVSFIGPENGRVLVCMPRHWAHPFVHRILPGHWQSVMRLSLV